jgi:hypothetical protein
MLAAQMEEHHEDQREFIQDSHTGGASMVRAMAQQVADAEGNQIPFGSVSFGDLQRLGGGAQPGGRRVASVWRSVGESFRRRDAELHRRIKSAAGVLRRLNAKATDYEIGQRLFDYLAGTKQVSDAQLAAETAALRGEIPSLDSAKFRTFPQLGEGSEAKVYHDEEGKIVYKLFKVQDGKTGAFVPGQMRLADGQIRLAAGARPSFLEFLERMARTNAAEDLTPTEFAAVTPDGYAVFGQPFVTGRAVSDKNASFALDSVGLKLITQMGGITAVGQVDDKLVLFDDLHGRNVKVAPNGRVEVIDAINRELTPGEAKKLREWRKLPAEFVQ